MMLISLFLCKFLSFPSTAILKCLTKVVCSKVKIFYTPNNQENLIHTEVYNEGNCITIDSSSGHISLRWGWTCKRNPAATESQRCLTCSDFCIQHFIWNILYILCEWSSTVSKLIPKGAERNLWKMNRADVKKQARTELHSALQNVGESSWSYFVANS